MRRRRLVVILAIGAVAVAVALALGRGADDGETAYTYIGSGDDFFQPQVLRVPVGTTVEWVNRGRNQHNIVADDGAYQSEILERGEEFEHTYEQAGVYPFFCSLHGTPGAGMSGIVAVGDVALGDDTNGVGPGREPVPTAPGRTIRVPAEQPTIQAAVDAAAPGDLVLVAPGVYNEDVLVLTPYLTIRGEDRTTTILDGETTRSNGIHVAEADGVVIENLTARHYRLNGFYWTGVQGYRGSYLTAYANGDYGIYAYGSQWGRFEFSHASGSPDSGFYIGECQPCHAVISDVVATGSALGYSGTNAGGDLWVVNSEWSGNGAGLSPNTLDSEGLAPQRGATFAGNAVFGNGTRSVPTKRLTSATYGAGFIVAGGRSNVIDGNVVVDNVGYGIAVLPMLDDNLWLSRENIVRDNLVQGSGRADLVLGGPARGGDCFAGNDHGTSIPPAIEGLAGCGLAPGDGGDLGPTLTQITRFLAAIGGNYEPGDWQHAPQPPAQPNMPGDVRSAPVLAVPEIAVPGPHQVRSIEATRAAAAASTPVTREVLIMGIPVASVGAALLGLYAYVLPLALYAAWVSLAIWDLVRREVPDRRRMGWMTVILAVPLLGPIAYFGLGGSQIPSGVRWFLVVGGILIYLAVAVLAGLVQAL